MRRFVALRYAPTEPPPPIVGEIVQLLCDAGFELAIDLWGLTLCHKGEGHDGDPIVLPRQRGVIFGSVFCMDGRRLTASDIDEKLAGEVTESAGRLLASHYWGDYVALLVAQEKGLVHVVRAPTGARAVYLNRRRELQIIFSDIDDLARCFGPLSANRGYVSGFLHNACLINRETGVEGVEELEAGVCVTFGKGDPQRSVLWRPGERTADPLETFASAAAALRETVEMCAGAWARDGGEVLHRLSGGLDSSIVLAAMRRAAPDVHIICANESAIDAPESDEREFACEVAAAFRSPLIELRVSAADGRLERLFEAPLTANPSLGLVSYANPFLSEAARGAGARMITSGEGGDQLFQRSPGPFAAADAARIGVPMRALLDVALDTAHVTGMSAWSVLGFALQKGFFRGRFNVRSQALLTPEPGVADDEAYLETNHIWLEDADRAAPGRAMQIWRLLDALSHGAIVEPSSQFKSPLVLCAQPIVELCLRIPPHLYYQGGEDRALWRTAFAEILPGGVLRRQTKGGATRYFVSMLQHNRDLIRERLLDGKLVQQRIVRRDRLEMLLAKPTWKASDKHMLLSCLCAEAWLTQLAAASCASPLHLQSR